MIFLLILVIIITLLFRCTILHNKDIGKRMGTDAQDNGVLLCEGGGFHAFWYSLGRATVLEHNMHTIIGYSSGAIVAALICSLPSPIQFNTVLVAALKAKRKVGTKIGSLYLVVKELLESLLPEDAHILCTGRCGIILCDPKLWFYSKIIRAWSSREDLINCIIASTYIPFIIGPTAVDPHFSCIDGGACMDLDHLRFNSSVTTQNKKCTASTIDVLFPISAGRALKEYEAGITCCS